MKLFKIEKPIVEAVPIIVNIPHAGTFIPSEIESHMREEPLTHLDDTDWYVDRLYDFAPSIGITTMAATHSRWVVDLNRNPSNQALYNDGRVITDLIPTTDFNGKPIYKNNEDSDFDAQYRIETYFLPYHQKLNALIEDKLNHFGKVLLFDAHSIRKHVKGISPTPFPDLILGDNEGSTAAPTLSKTVKQVLSHSTYQFAYNTPFKGGFITRHYGNPAQNIHTLQLEMSKTVYMDSSETQYHEENSSKIRHLLKNVFEQLIEIL